MLWSLLHPLAQLGPTELVISIHNKKGVIVCPWLAAALGGQFAVMFVLGYVTLYGIALRLKDPLLWLPRC